MAAATALIPGLDGIVRHGHAQRRLKAARRIALLFFEDAASLRPVHIILFDGLLIDLIGRTIGLDWRKVHALILLRLGPKRVLSQRDIDAIKVNYARLLPSTAEHVVAFWKTRH